MLSHGDRDCSLWVQSKGTLKEEDRFYDKSGLEGDKGMRVEGLRGRSPVQVQVHDIPMQYMTTEVAENLCDIIGEVVRSIGAETEEGSCFMRVRVKVDIAKPLCRGRLITFKNGEKT
ncbi:hypothetical protein CFP56_040757 [Quercus suber]|uniref:Uncharacterized protein n=1 Tax=Quercus suber TaxID=58331 RepID=A0AAW0LLB3_QUESU